MTDRDLRAADALLATGIASSAPEEVLCWTGAGISFDAPTCGPLGGELTERALSHLFEPDCLAQIRDCYSKLGIARQYPRLETVLDVVRRIIGADALLDVLSDLRRPQPNDLHAFFARHLDAGGRHVTANFDDCIERSRGAATGDELIHFHGSFVSDPTGESLGATLGAIQRGFPHDLSEDLRQALGAASVIVFAGYSGYDAFDVGPFLRSLGPARALEGRAAVWIRFRPSGDDLVMIRDGDSPDDRVGDAFARLAAAGAECWEIEGELRAVLAALADQWSWPQPALPAPAACPRMWDGTRVATDQERRRASLELYAMMGMQVEVRRLLARQPPATPSEREIAAHAAASAGRYRQAAELWRAAIPGSSATERARREQHVASCWWREGRLLKAYRHLRREARTAIAADVDGLLLWQLASTTAHVFGHMRRRPLLRFFPTRRRRRWFARLLPTPGADGYQSFGPHVDALLAAARSRLEQAQEHSQATSLMFDEAEALNGMLNFRHADLRRRGSSHARSEWPSGDEYQAQQAHFRRLGLDADVVRVPLLPRAARFFMPREVWRGLGKPDFTLWHRLMLFAGYLIDRLAPGSRA